MSTDQISQEQLEQEIAARHNAIKAKFDNRVDVRQVSFGFKSVEVKDENGKPVYETKDGKPVLDKDGKPTPKLYKRPTVELDVPCPSIEGIVYILENGDELQQRLLLDAVADVIISRAREHINENEDVKQDNFPLEILSWEAISKIPPKQRRGAGIAKEVWEAFTQDYIATMVEGGFRGAEEAAAAANILKQKFQPVKTAKKVIRFLLKQLDLYTAHTKNGEQFADCVAFLQEKGNTLLEADEKSLLANLGADDE
jgi:hypothetical protein